MSGWRPGGQAAAVPSLQNIHSRRLGVREAPVSFGSMAMLLHGRTARVGVDSSGSRRDVYLTWFQRQSLGAQLAGVLALVVLLLVLSLTTVVSAMMQAQIERDKGAALASLGRSVATALGKSFRDRMQQVDVLVQSSEIWKYGLDAPAVAQALARTKRTRPFPSWIGVADLQGTVRVATDELLVGRVVKERPWFVGGLQERYVGDVHEAKLLASLLPAPSNGEPLRFVDFAAPLKVDGRVIGVVGLHADVQGARSVVEAFLPKNAAARRVEVYIFTRSGEIVFGVDREARVNVSELAQLLADQAPIAPGEQARPAVDIAWGDGKHYLTTSWSLDAYAPELGLGWQVLVRQPIEVAYAPAVEAARSALAVGLLFAALAVAGGLLLGRQLTRPIKQIARAARDVEAGVPGAVIPDADHNQELSHLSNALQAMTLRLESLVQERTAQLHEANHELRVIGEEQGAMLDNELIGIVRQEMNSRTAIWSNRAMAKLFGYSPEELIRHESRSLYADEASYKRVGTEARAAFAEGLDYVTKVQMLHKNGTPIWIHLHGTPLKERQGEALWMMTDVTSQHLYQEQVEHIAFHDALTGLPNRLLLADRVNQAVVASQRSGRICAIAFIDLDGFKAVNDTHGHEAGDQLLKEIARRAVAAVRVGDTVARLGGDEFVLVIGGLDDRVRCDVVLGRLLESIAKPVLLSNGAIVSVTGSVGVALCPEVGVKPSLLLAAADRAMYEAKNAGKSCLRYATAEPSANGAP